MDMDLDISRWILEFLVRNVMDDDLLEQVISILPPPDKDSGSWKKTMLLRTMHSEILDGSVSEKLLDLLETIAEVDRREGFVLFETMKSAYCAVAVDCTVRFMEENGNCVGKYFEAVERIWRGRIGNLEKSESVDLISDELRSWRDVIEAAVWDDKACKENITSNSRNEALKAVRAYVTEAWKVMGPTFLEVAAKKTGNSLMESQKLGEHRRLGQVGERLSILPNASLGVCKSNVRDEYLAGERVLNPPDAHQNLGVSDECALEDETQAGDRGKTSSGFIDGSIKPAAINENQDEHIASQRPNVGGDVGVIDELANRDKCQVIVEASSSVHQDLDGSAKPATKGEIHVEQIRIPLTADDGNFADVQAKRSKYQVQERASTSFDASRDSTGDRSIMKAKYQYRDGVTIFPRHLGGSTEPAITSGNQAEDIVISLPNVGVELNVSDELTKRDKYQVKEGATTFSSASEDWGVREGSLVKHKDQCGEGAANICPDSGGSTNSAMPVNNQAEQMARPLDNARWKLSVTNELTVTDKDQDEERAAMTLSVPASRAKEVENHNVLPKRKLVGGHCKRSRRGIKIADVEELSVDISSSKFDCLPSPEVNKVQEALRSSSLELKAVVKDPLPEALRLAEAVISDMGSKHMNNEPSVETLDRIDVDVTTHSVDESVEAIQVNQNNVSDLFSGPQNDDPRPSLIEETHNRMDANAPKSFITKSSVAVQGNEDNPGNRCSSHQNNVPRPSLLARNGTARTYEWDESIDGSSEGPSTSKRPYLTSPKRRAVSPLKKYEPAKLTRRRQNRKWSNVEEDTLRTGVQRFGRGNWKLILNSYPDIFEERTEVDLKDKWRNMMK